MLQNIFLKCILQNNFKHNKLFIFPMVLTVLV